MTNYEYFIQTAEREFAITLKLIKAFPGDKLDFTPHQVSSPARTLFMTFLVGCDLMKKITTDSMHEWSGMDPYNRDSLLEFVDSFELMISETLTAVRGLGEDGAEQMYTGFGSKQRKVEGLWAMLLDQIHHRGQLSVYIRLAGGKVPQIYGPSADEPVLPDPKLDRE